MVSGSVEAEVLKRYEELGGLVRDGRMVNKDKESRARQYVKSRKELIERIAEGANLRKNAKYGEFIIQANEVHFYLVKLIFLRSFDQGKGFEKILEGAQLGHLIGYLRVCAKTDSDIVLLELISDYKDKRNALAHKMFTNKKLTPQECEKALKLGKRIIQCLLSSLKEEIEAPMLKKTDKISDFPDQFNKLIKLVESLEKRIKKLEVKTKSKK